MIAPVCASTTMVASQHGQMTVQLFVSATALHLRTSLRPIRNCRSACAGGFGREYSTRAQREGSRGFDGCPLANKFPLTPTLPGLRRDGVLHGAADLLRALGRLAADLLCAFRGLIADRHGGVRCRLAHFLRAPCGRVRGVAGLVGDSAAYVLRYVNDLAARGDE